MAKVIKQTLQPIFTTELPNLLRLMSFFHLDLTEFGSPLMITIPIGFTWDGASVPRAFWLTMGGPYQPRFITASLVHDYLYKNKPLRKALADKIFYKLLRANGVGRINSFRMYAGVKVGGWFAWRKK